MALVDLAKGMFSKPDEHGENEMVLRSILDSGLKIAKGNMPPEPVGVIHDIERRIKQGTLAECFKEVKISLAGNNVSAERIKDFDRIVENWQQENAEEIKKAMEA